jgi:hypothetical protein
MSYKDSWKEFLREGVSDEEVDRLRQEALEDMVEEGFWNKKKEAPNPHKTYADVLENAVKVMTRQTESFPEGNGINYVIWGPNDDPFDRELQKLGSAFTKRLKEVAAEHRTKEDAKDYKKGNSNEE